MLSAAATLQAASAHADLSETYGSQDRESNYLTERGSSRPPRYPSQPPMPPMPPPPTQSWHEARTTIPNITRQTGGQWYRLLLRRPLRLERIDLTVQAQRLRIHEASLVTRSGRIVIQELSSSAVISAGTSVISQNLNVGEDILAIDLRLESYGGTSSAMIKVSSLDGVPNLSLENSQPAPPVYNNVSLKGYCADEDHQQFWAAKSFAFSSSGLDMSDSRATNWALSYNQTHKCGTIAEFKARFAVLFDRAFSTSGLDMSGANARQYALDLVESTSVSEAQEMTATLRTAKNFAFSTSGLNMSSSNATDFARAWIESRCEDGRHIENVLLPMFKKEFSFAFSTSGLNMSSSDARRYATNKVAPLTRCGHLIRR